MPIGKNHTALDDRTAIEDKEISREAIKQIFWQTCTNEQRPKFKKIQVNDIIIEGRVYTGVDVTIIAPESWHPNWPL